MVYIRVLRLRVTPEYVSLEEGEDPYWRVLMGGADMDVVAEWLIGHLKRATEENIKYAREAVE